MLLCEMPHFIRGICACVALKVIVGAVLRFDKVSLLQTADVKPALFGNCSGCSTSELRWSEKAFAFSAKFLACFLL